MAAESITKMMAGIHAEGRTVLLEHEAYALVEQAGLPVPRHFFIARGEKVDPKLLSALPGEKVILKISSPDILHKSDVGGVKVVAKDPQAVDEAVEAVLASAAAADPQADLRGVLVAEKVAFAADLPGSEYLLSLRQDPAFGPVLMFGMGGLLSEWYGKFSSGQAHHLFSANDFSSDASVESLKSTSMGKLALEKSRLHSTSPLDAGALGQAMEGLAALAREGFEDSELILEELEINPIAAVDGKPIALDALARIGTRPAPARPPRPVEKIFNLLYPKSALIYGASTKGNNPGRVILRNLKQSDGLSYGHLYAIHPKAENIDGIPCYPSAKEVPETVDLAVISIAANLAPGAIEELVREKKARSIILIPGGFAETGEGELAKQITRTLAESRQSEDRGPVMVGGNCLGIVSKDQYNTFFLPTYKLPFHRAPGENVVAISQSGAYLVTFNSNLDGVIFPRASVSYGNEMDLTASDFLEYYLDHETGAKVFAVYIEGFQPGEGERLLSLVRRIRAAGKVVVMYKAGHTDAGAKAAASHTASIAGDYAVAKTLLEEAGAVVCDTLNMFEDYTKVLTMFSDHSCKGNRVAVITNAGFEAGAVSDHLHGLQLAEFSEDTRAKLAEVLPPIAHTGNPVDVTPMTQTDQFAQSVKILAEAPEVDVIIASPIPATPALDMLPPDFGGSHQENVYSQHSLPAALIRLFETYQKPMVVTVDSGRLYDPSVVIMERGGLPVYRKIDRASRALGAFVQYGCKLAGIEE